jgi:hypothetical protein
MRDQVSYLLFPRFCNVTCTTLIFSYETRLLTSKRSAFAREPICFCLRITHLFQVGFLLVSLQMQPAYISARVNITMLLNRSHNQEYVAQSDTHWNKLEPSLTCTIKIGNVQSVPPKFTFSICVLRTNSKLRAIHKCYLK